MSTPKKGWGGKGWVLKPKSDKYAKSEKGIAAARRSSFKTQLKTYGMTVAEYVGMQVMQGGVCAICGEVNAREERLSVDRDHETGLVRGLVCHRCNLSLGHAGDNWYQLMRLAEYILER